MERMKKKHEKSEAVIKAVLFLAGCICLSLAAKGTEIITESVPEMRYEEFPRIDGSLACVPMIEALAQKVTGCSEEEAEKVLDMFSNTNPSYLRLAQGYTDILLVYEAAEETKEKLKDYDMLKQTVVQMQQQMNAMRITDSAKAGFSDVPAGHWASNAVSTLHGIGLVQGYPDGKFHGDQKMTRYEYAEMLYNALTNGAEVKKDHLREYKAELMQVEEQRRVNGQPVVNVSNIVADTAMQVAGQMYNAYNDTVYAKAR